jgi:hypothetical protein
VISHNPEFDDPTLAAEAADSPDPTERDIEHPAGPGVHEGQIDDTPEDGDSLFPIVE